MPRLIWVFAGRTGHFVGFVMQRFKSLRFYVSEPEQIKATLQLPIECTAKADQTGWMPRLIRVFAGHTCRFVGFVMQLFKSLRVYVSESEQIKATLQLPIECIAKADQTGWMPRLIWVFAGCTGHFVGFIMRPLKSLHVYVSESEQIKATLSRGLHGNPNDVFGNDFGKYVSFSATGLLNIQLTFGGENL